MKLSMFAVLDAKVGFFGNPFCEHKEESALRAFADAVNDGSNPNNQWHRHPEDFALYKIADYDSETATITSLKSLKCLASASALKKEPVPMFDSVVNGNEKLTLA